MGNEQLLLWGDSLGDDDAEFTLGSAEDFDLAWYAPGEIRYLLEELPVGDPAEG